MSVLAAAMLVLFDAARSSVALRLRSLRRRPVPRTPADTTLRLVNPAVAEWPRAADRVAADELLSTRRNSIAAL